MRKLRLREFWWFATFFPIHSAALWLILCGSPGTMWWKLFWSSCLPIRPPGIGAAGLWGYLFQAPSCPHQGGRLCLCSLYGKPSSSGGQQQPVGLLCEWAWGGAAAGTPLHSSRSLTQGVGLSLVLGVWDLPELFFSVPVRGEAQRKIAQSGI